MRSSEPGAWSRATCLKARRWSGTPRASKPRLRPLAHSPGGHPEVGCIRNRCHDCGFAQSRNGHGCTSSRNAGRHCEATPSSANLPSNFSQPARESAEGTLSCRLGAARCDLNPEPASSRHCISLRKTASTSRCRWDCTFAPLFSRLRACDWYVAIFAGALRTTMEQ